MTKEKVSDIVFARVDKYTAELIDLTAKKLDISKSKHVYDMIRSQILAGMTRDGKGRSYYAVVIDMIKKLKEGK
jgi:hypothetical protein